MRARSSWPAVNRGRNLGEAIPEAFDFDDAHLWAFFLSGTPWDRATEYGIDAKPGDFLATETRGARSLRIDEAPTRKEFRRSPGTSTEPLGPGASDRRVTWHVHHGWRGYSTLAILP